jgi:hypothetical protein
LVHNRCIKAEHGDIPAEARCLQNACSWDPQEIRECGLKAVARFDCRCGHL